MALLVAALAQAPSTILATKIAPNVAPPGAVVRIAYAWRAVPLGRNVSAFVHVVALDGTMVFQDDHEPPGGTARWSGPVAYTRRIWLPKTLADGRYRIEAGLYERSADGKGWRNLTLATGRGVKPGADGHYEVGTLTIDRRAPMPRESDRKATLDLKGFRKTFDESFDGPLSISAWGPNGLGGTR